MQNKLKQIFHKIYYNSLLLKLNSKKYFFDYFLTLININIKIYFQFIKLKYYMENVNYSNLEENINVIVRNNMNI